MTKTILNLIIAILFTGQAFAKCASSAIWTYPENGVIKQNSWIIIHGYASSQEIIKSLNKDYPIYLEGDGHKVKLVVKNTYKGLFRLTQAILVPSEKLITGKTYILKIDNLKEDQKSNLSKWNSKLRKEEPIQWKVENGIDSEKPRFINQPEFVDTNVEVYGCGPEISADFTIKTQDESQVLVKAELVDLKTGESNTFFLTIDENEIVSVGHGMCSGAFSFRDSRKYKVRFSLMDICGNQNSESSKWLTFDSPY
ncbi:hypothetical protein [Aureivirga sp. CE67]|uniref:hypothetical protein n=1 Tax=Aureivirga sp. CE67 TaxID=1788983 RepID=UPI0018C9A257|nr:hypothetical protein [Aureivirga sp. CE67]